MDLSVNATYVVSRQTPVMPEPYPEDPIKALEKVLYLPKSHHFTVLEIYSGAVTWYKVKTTVGDGWIKSTALLGQQLGEHDGTA